jgi:hypothetical protein
MMNTALNNESLRALTPAAFADYHDMSDRYGMIRTADVLERMRDVGYFPVSAKQDNPRRRNPMHVRHCVVLRHERFLDLDAPKVGDQLPQILLTNSHNGRTKLHLRAGFYRFVCANGLVVGNDRFHMAIVHRMNAPAMAMEFAEQMTRQLDDLNNVIDLWSRVELTRRRQLHFAREAAKLRFGATAPAYKPEQLLQARRVEDQGATLWQAYNTVQENATKGGLQGTNANGRAVASRELTGIGQDLEFNTGLWQLAERMAA